MYEMKIIHLYTDVMETQINNSIITSQWHQ